MVTYTCDGSYFGNCEKLFSSVVGVSHQGYANGSANTIRRTSCTYPDGRVVNYGYSGTAADKLSRVDRI